MTADELRDTVELMLDELDGHPINSMSTGDVQYVQKLGWSYEVRRAGRVVRRGFNVEPMTGIEIEDLLKLF